MCRNRSTPDPAGHVAQHVGAEAVGAHERVAVLDRAVDVGLGGEVDDGVVAVHRRQHVVLVADVGVHEAAASVVEHVADALEVAGVGERVVDVTSSSVFASTQRT